MVVGWTLQDGPDRAADPTHGRLPDRDDAVAISCSMFTERFGGDVSLSAQGIFYSTLFSLLTVPVFFFIIQRLGL